MDPVHWSCYPDKLLTSQVNELLVHFFWSTYLVVTKPGPYPNSRG
jgi:hypothetical protein